ncbi:DUF6959 family protein [Streptomyces sp. NPDC092369]|uniref:DUF6959 family protein n=1 Tax=Streptomyces sp. NPDC092369 TaxID=3366015 RepID=UPI003821AB1B
MTWTSTTSSEWTSPTPRCTEPSGRSKPTAFRYAARAVAGCGGSTAGESLSTDDAGTQCASSVDVAEFAEACARGDLDEARDCAGLLLAELDGLLARYEAALDEHGVPRPY